MLIWSRLAVAVLLPAVVTAFHTAAHAYDPPEVLWSGDSGAGNLVNAAVIDRTDGGYRFIAGKQNTHLTITLQDDGRLLFVDTGTAELRNIPATCARMTVAQGIAAVCQIPAALQTGDFYLEVWPRLGNDFVDGSTLPARFRMWVLTDSGRDTVRLGAGDDFVNGAKGLDRVWGGAGDDWIRTGPGNDVIWGGDGNDKLVGTDDDDSIHGGEGNDRVDGGPGADSLWADGGTDVVACSDGLDVAYADSLDRLVECESVSSS